MVSWNDVVGFGKVAVEVMKIMQRQCQLPEIVCTRASVSSLAHLLHGRQQKANERTQNRDDDQELDESKAVPDLPRWCSHASYLLCQEIFCG